MHMYAQNLFQAFLRLDIKQGFATCFMYVYLFCNMAVRVREIAFLVHFLTVGFFGICFILCMLKNNIGMAPLVAK